MTAPTRIPLPAVFDGAICTQIDPEVFFPPAGGRNQAAKRICHTCPAKAGCLQWAIDNGPVKGIWGGTTEHDRRTTAAATRLAELDIDPVAVERAMDGDPVRLNRAERLAAVRALTAQGRTSEEIADVLHMSTRVVFRYRGVAS